MKTIKTLFFVVLGIFVLIVGLIFCLANMTPVTLKFYHYETIPVPLWFLVIISILIGAVLTVLLIVLDLYKGSRKLSSLKKELKSMEKKLYDLKNKNQELETQKINLEQTISKEHKKQELNQSEQESNPKENEAN